MTEFERLSTTNERPGYSYHQCCRQSFVFPMDQENRYVKEKEEKVKKLHTLMLFLLLRRFSTFFSTWFPNFLL